MKTRVISAVVLLTITFTCVLVSPVTRVLFFAVVAGLCAYEFSKNVEKLEARCTLWVMFVYIAAQAALVILQDIYAVFDTGMLAYCVLFVFCIYLALFSGVIQAGRRQGCALHARGAHLSLRSVRDDNGDKCEPYMGVHAHPRVPVDLGVRQLRDVRRQVVRQAQGRPAREPQ